MSTLKATNLQHPSAASPNVVMGSTGSVAVAGALTGAGMDLISVSTFSAVSSVSVNNIFTSAYANYRIVISDLVQVTAGGVAYKMRLRASGVDNAGTSTYGNYGLWADYGGSGATRTLATSWDLSTLGSYGQAHVIMDVCNPAKAVMTTATAQISTRYGAGVNGVFQTMGHLHDVASAYDGFSLFTNTAPTDTASGTIRVYGLRNS